MSQRDHNQQDYYDELDLEDKGTQGYGGRRNELVSFPNSVIDRSRQDLVQFQQQSQQAMREAMQQLAQHQGDLMTLLLATPYGKSQIDFNHEDTTMEVTETLKYRMGVVVGKDVTTKTTTKIQKRHHRLY